ncbi:MAG TPA: hypothetical protein VEX38_03660, partial [Fimbriimonadaceae bacterium]|nr:hypothetical protein [Fimbriimonadaceae bacterium]
LIDVAAIRDAAQAGVIESRAPIEKPLDVLVQHLVTIALGGGFSEEDLLKEVRTTYSYRDLAPEEWKWALDFVTRGGGALSTYPDFNRVVEAGGVFTVEDRHIARRHRMSIGTITSDSAMVVQYYRGHTLGTIEESFISRLNPGDKFVFSGKPLQFVRTKDMAAIVKPASSAKGAIPRWMGGRLPLSAELSSAIRLKLEEASQGELPSPEMQKVAPLLKLQQRWSAIPSREELLVERVKTREGHHLYLFPFEGRLVHEGLAALLAYRLSRLRPITFTLACNDYGIELLSPIEAPFEEGVEAGLLSTERIAEDVLEALNASEMARRQFREIARIAGLIFQGFPGAHKSTRQIQASSSLFYDVFAKYDPENLLLYQARVEVLERQLESTRLASTLHRLSTAKLLITNPPRPTPLSFPILVDRLRETVSSEPLSDRISKMVVRLEREADREETRSAKKKG